jgi:hypothetical protein
MVCKPHIALFLLLCTVQMLPAFGDRTELPDIPAWLHVIPVGIDPGMRRGDNQFRRGGDNQYDEPPAGPTHEPLDDPVLIWLPEILTAAEETGVSPSLIAGMIQVESQGELLATSPHGARGLMQMVPEQLVAQGILEHLWHDPATNISPVPVCWGGTSRRTARHGTDSPTTSASVATDSAAPTPM